jgi:hypothetical protein
LNLPVHRDELRARLDRWRSGRLLVGCQAAAAVACTMRIAALVLIVVALHTPVLAVCGCAKPVDFEPHDDRYERCGALGMGRRADGDETSVTGTILRMVDATPVDGPVSIVLVDGKGDPVKLYFGSLFTVPPPSPGRRATYDAISHDRIGDCVWVSGPRMSDGRISVKRFVDLGRE